jgi:hypothetical protein
MGQSTSFHERGSTLGPRRQGVEVGIERHHDRAPGYGTSAARSPGCRQLYGCESRRQQLAAIMRELKAASKAKGLSLADIHERTGMDRSALSKLENVADENPTIDTPLRYAGVVGKRLQIQVVDSHHGQKWLV